MSKKDNEKFPEGKAKYVWDQFRKAMSDAYGEQPEKPAEPAKFNKETFMEAKAKDGSDVYYDGEMPMVGMPIWIKVEGQPEPIPAAPGIIEMQDGSVLEIGEGGILAAIKSAPQQQEQPGSPAAKTDMPMSEQAAKRIVESVIKESHFSKDEVNELIKGVKEEFASQVATLVSENKELVRQLAEAKAETSTLTEKFKSHEKFSEKITELLKEIGEEPQVKSEKKAEEFRADKSGKTDNPAKLNTKEWREKYGV